MQIELRQIPIREIMEGYFNDAEAEEGVIGYDDQLDIRPKYQRNYVYKDSQRDEVVRTVMKGFPLSIFYWVDTGEDHDEDEARYNVLDGQQRTISICDYIDGVFSVDGHYFETLPSDIKNKILDYPLMVYVCTGDESEQLDWFKTINIAGEQLTPQELRNAVYAGAWTSDAKRYFSKSKGPAYQLAGDYMKGDANRQDYLEQAIKWHMQVTEEPTIEEYMSKRADKHQAVELWSYFRSIFDWVQATFPKYRAIMKGLDWGRLYNEHHEREDLNPDELESKIKALLADPDVTKKKGVYEYVLTGDERHLNIRQFDERDRIAAYESQDGICPQCGKKFEFKDMRGDHIIPWSKGGKTTAENCRMLCADCNQRLSNQAAKPID